MEAVRVRPQDSGAWIWRTRDMRCDHQQGFLGGEILTRAKSRNIYLSLQLPNSSKNPRLDFFGTHYITVAKPCIFRNRACGPETCGLLQRAHITANWPPVYIGKEHARHFEQGEDLTLLDFHVIQYRRKGNAVATDEQLQRIAEVPKREFMRRGINQHTLEKICNREPVRAIKLAKCLKMLEESES
jgi:hypothetical protein